MGEDVKQHHQTLVDGELVESITMEVFDKKQTLYKKEIPVDQYYFDNLINSDNEDKRNKTMLAEAADAFGEPQVL